MSSTEPAAVRGAEDAIDGRTQIVLENGESRLVVDPAQGGRWVTWDLTPASGETRRLFSAPGTRITAGPAVLTGSGQTPEIATELGPAAPSGLGDHFLPLTGTQRDFALGQARELGTFAGAAFAAVHYAPARDQYEILLRSEGGIKGAKRLTPLRLLKKLTLGRPGGEISVHYRLDNPNARALQIFFGVEFCFALSPQVVAAGREQRAYEFDGAPERGGYGVSGIATNTTSVTLRDPQPGLTVRLGWERPANVWVCPAPAGAGEAASRGASVTAVWDLRVPPEDNWAVNLWLQGSASGPVRPLAPEVVARIARLESEDEPWK